MRRLTGFHGVLRLVRWATGGVYGEALCGDLLEELERTGAAGRFWREIALAVLRGLWERGLQPLVFSAGWSLMYPAWQAMEGGRVWPVLAARSYGMAWPYSSVALLASAGLSPLLFVWCGALLYLLRNEHDRRRSVRWFHAVRGLSLSLSVLLVSCVGLMRAAGGEGMAGRLAGVAVFAPGIHLSWLSLCLTLSLLVATYPARPSQLRRRLS